jgi:ATP-dependent helicase/nuclease subunit A
MTAFDDILAAYPPSPEQAPAIQTRGRDLAVVAGAGSGKTRTLVGRYLSLLQDGLPLRHIVAITFTNKAAREMRNRVRRQITAFLERPLDDAQRAFWRQRLDQMDSARISTIHSFCGELLRAHPTEANVDPQFAVLEEGSQALLQLQMTAETMAWAVEQQALVSLFTALGATRIEALVRDGLKHRLELEEALALDDDLPTRWRTVALHWFEHQLSQPAYAHSMALLRALHARGDIDAAEARGDKLVPYVRAVVGLLPDIEQARQQQDIAGLVTALLAVKSHSDLRPGSARNWPGEFPKDLLRELRTVLDPLAKQLEKCDPAQDGKLVALAPGLKHLLGAAFARYRQAKDQQNVADFDDLEANALALLRAHPEVLARWQEQIDSLLVDEFQDTNRRQRDLVVLLSGADNGERPGGRLFVVGDAKQSIYRFRGADVAVFAAQQRAVERRGGLVCHLATSYRAHSGLLAGLNELMQRALPSAEAELTDFQAAFEPLQAQRRAPAVGVQEPFIECHLAFGRKTDGVMDEVANGLAARLVALVEQAGIQIAEEGRSRPLGYGDVAILCRRSAGFGPYEDALERAHISYVTISGRGFYERPEIRDLLNLLRALDDPDDDLALAGALRSPALGLSDVGLYRLCVAQRALGTEAADRPPLWHMASQMPPDNLDAPDRERLSQAVALIDELRQLVGRTPVATVLKRLLERTHYRAIVRHAGQGRALANIDKLLSDAYTSGLVGLGTFIEYVQGLRDVGAREGEARSLSEGAVQIMSIHAAKGLEFPVVVLGDLSAAPGHRAPDLLIDEELGPVLKLNEDDKTPFVYCLAKLRQAEREEAETARLFYVAATRARELLLLSGNLPEPTKGVIPAGDGWLKLLLSQQMLAVAGEDPPSLSPDEPPVRWLRLLGQTPVALTFYPPDFAMQREAPPSSDTVPRFEGAWPLLAAVRPTADLDPDEAPDGKRASRAIYRVVQRGRGYPPRVLGDIVHAALERWRFPGEGFREWAGAIAESRGLIDRPTIDAALSTAERLLRRFQGHLLYAEMAAAPTRWHEVPFSVPWDGEPHDGRIDALYQDGGGAWHIVEFKTDRARNAAQVRALADAVDRGYRQQVAEYRRAAGEWLGQPVDGRLVFLNCATGIEVLTV